MKRAFDLVIVLVVSPLAVPLAAIVTGAVYLDLGWPVIYRQTRPGLGGEPFGLLKFRTMTNARDSDGALLQDSLRLSRIGRMLRRWSLDELPELVNIIKGEMSLVGPRPLLMEYLPLYSQTQVRRHEVLPGLTGWAQVNGRNALTWEQKFELDVWYVDHRSFTLDLKILWRTVCFVVSGKGVTQDGHVTTERFRGFSP